jgi:hypothetical protein
MIEMTEEEKQWIRKVKRLLAKKPPTVALFGCESGLVALRAIEGSRGARPVDQSGCVDSSQALDILTIDCDGGAW